MTPSTDKARMFLVGLLLLACGLALAWPPLALIVPGAIFLAVAFLMHPQTREGSE